MGTYQNIKPNQSPGLILSSYTPGLLKQEELFPLRRLWCLYQISSYQSPWHI